VYGSSSHNTMCIDCARSRLQFLSEAFNPRGARADGSDARWFICVRDHDAHVHIRVQVDLEEQGDEGHPDYESSEWVQINTTFEVFKQALAETNIRHVFHIHEAAEPPPKQGLSEQLIGSLPQIRVDAAAEEESRLSGELCPVCYDAFHEGEMVTRLPCAHTFHAACVGEWLVKADTCPACRAVVTEAAVEASLAELSTAAPAPEPEPEPEPEREAPLPGLVPQPEPEPAGPPPALSRVRSAEEQEELSVWQRLSCGRSRGRHIRTSAAGSGRRQPAPPVRATAASTRRAVFIDAGGSAGVREGDARRRSTGERS
jgi:hypothetical protein